MRIRRASQTRCAAGTAGERNGQNLSTPLGKLLRVDVDRGSPFTVPADNPFATTAGAFPAIWAYGLRSITGGPVYRGCRMPGYAGTYFYGDYCTAFIRSFRLENGVATDIRDWTSQLGRGVGAIQSFGVDADGEMYILDGEVYQIIPAS